MIASVATTGSKVFLLCVQGTLGVWSIPTGNAVSLWKKKNHCKKMYSVVKKRGEKR